MENEIRLLKALQIAVLKKEINRLIHPVHHYYNQHIMTPPKGHISTLTMDSIQNDNFEMTHKKFKI